MAEPVSPDLAIFSYWSTASVILGDESNQNSTHSTGQDTTPDPNTIGYRHAFVRENMPLQ